MMFIGSFSLCIKTEGNKKWKQFPFLLKLINCIHCFIRLFYRLALLTKMLSISYGNSAINQKSTKTLILLRNECNRNAIK